jgi:hypothetical protein
MHYMKTHVYIKFQCNHFLGVYKNDRMLGSNKFMKIPQNWNSIFPLFEIWKKRSNERSEMNIPILNWQKRKNRPKKKKKNFIISTTFFNPLSIIIISNHCFIRKMCTSLFTSQFHHAAFFGLSLNIWEISLQVAA